MNNYYLFLDESKPTDQVINFVLGGCIISEEEYKTKIVPAVNHLKNTVFGTTEAILHETDIRYAKKGIYKLFRKQEKRELFWNGLHQIFTDANLYTISAVINCNEYQKIYDSSNFNTEYFVALQIILENFVHFLEKVNGKGTIFIESRNNTEDNRLTNHYYTIVANGTLFINKLAFQKRLTTINFAIKQDNSVGLQLTDFVLNPINRFYSTLDQKEYSLYNIIEDKLYDGGVNMKNRFGIKRIP
jgi:hypothetical protein